MPTFNSVNIFGRSVSVVPNINPRDDQRIAAPGVNGVAALDLGSRGRVFRVRGFLYGTLASDLLAAESLFMSYWDGRPYALVDSFGVTWPYVKLERWTPGDRILRDQKWGYCRNYEAEFFSLT